MQRAPASWTRGRRPRRLHRLYLRSGPKGLLRATLGAGSTQSNTGAWTAGGELRYTLSPLSRTSVFLAVQAAYANSSSGVTYAGSAATSQPGATPVAQAYGGSGGLFGGGAGVRHNVGKDTAVYGELRYDRATSGGVYDSWGSFRATDVDRVSFGLGLARPQVARLCGALRAARSSSAARRRGCRGAPSGRGRRPSR